MRGSLHAARRGKRDAIALHDAPHFDRSLQVTNVNIATF
jgi:hypothetical protein